MITILPLVFHFARIFGNAKSLVNLVTKATITLCDLSVDSFVLMLSFCANLKAKRYESTSLKRIIADKLHRVIVA